MLWVPIARLRAGRVSALVDQAIYRFFDLVPSDGGGELVFGELVFGELV